MNQLIVIYSESLDDVGYYTVQIKGILQTLPVLYSATSIEFTLGVQAHECSLVDFVYQSIPTITFTMSSSATAATYTFSPFAISTTPINCGPQKYTLYEKHTSVSLNSGTRTISVFTTSLN